MRVPDDPRFEALLNDGYTRLVAGLALITRDKDAAAEAVAEAIARAWEQIRKGREIESLDAWVRVVALNHARRTFRRRTAERRAQERLIRIDPEPVDTVEAAQGPQGSLVELVDTLPRRQREIVVLRYVLGLSAQEIGDELGISRGTVDRHLMRAKQKLAAALRARGEEPKLETLQ
jgi:RNA polymerase sigma factor (sigma-70 family)